MDTASTFSRRVCAASQASPQLLSGLHIVLAALSAAQESGLLESGCPVRGAFAPPLQHGPPRHAPDQGFRVCHVHGYLTRLLCGALARLGSAPQPSTRLLSSVVHIGLRLVRRACRTLLGGCSHVGHVLRGALGVVYKRLPCSRAIGLALRMPPASETSGPKDAACDWMCAHSKLSRSKRGQPPKPSTSQPLLALDQAPAIHSRQLALLAARASTCAAPGEAVPLLALGATVVPLAGEAASTSGGCRVDSASEMPCRNIRAGRAVRRRL